jgi:altronate dehydratase
MIMSFIFLMTVLVSNPIHFVNAQENQTETQAKKTTESIKNLIEELKKDHPNAEELEALLIADPNTLVEKLSTLDSQEAVHVLLTIETLEKLNDLLASHILEEQTN